MNKKQLRKRIVLLAAILFVVALGIVWRPRAYHMQGWPDMLGRLPERWGLQWRTDAGNGMNASFYKVDDGRGNYTDWSLGWYAWRNGSFTEIGIDGRIQKPVPQSCNLVGTWERQDVAEVWVIKDDGTFVYANMAGNGEGTWAYAGGEEIIIGLSAQRLFHITCTDKQFSLSGGPLEDPIVFNLSGQDQ